MYLSHNKFPSIAIYYTMMSLHTSLSGALICRYIVI